MKWLKEASLRARLLGLLALGILFLLISKRISWDHGLSHDLGIACVVAATLGLTVDFALKAELARDAFKATLGYILRPEFRNEVARVTSYEFLCEHHVLLIEVTLLENHVVEVVTSIERTIRNITASPKKVRNYLHIDDWGFDNGPSQITACDLIFEGMTYSGKSVETEPFRQKWETKEVTLESQ